MIRHLVDGSKQELLNEVSELKEAMSNLLKEKQRLTDELSNSESNYS